MANNHVDKVTLGGLWKRKTKTGKVLLSGKVKVDDLRQAVRHATDGVVEVTCWVNDKKTEKSPDVTLTMGKPYVAPKRQQPPQQTLDDPFDDAPPFPSDNDIPF